MTDLTREQIEALWAGAAPHKYGNYLHIANLARQLLATMTALAEAQAAQAIAVERAVDACVSALFVQFTNQARHLASRKPVIVASLADPTGVALLAELRDRAEKAEAGEDKWMNRCMEEVGQHLETKAERDRLAAANAALEAQVGARRAERDQLRAAVEGLIAVLDRNGEKGPIPDVEMMFCWLAAQNVRAAFRNTEGRGDMTDDEALETLFAMANVQDGYAKKATDRGLKIIHKANAKAQREVAATINDLRARLASAEAERDRLSAANAALEAKVAGLVEAAEDAEYDLLQWLECSKSLTAAGFNMDGTADVTAKLTAALSHIKRGKTNG